MLKTATEAARTEASACEEIAQEDAEGLAMEDNSKKPFIHVEPGADMEHVVVRGNVYVGPGSFVKNEGRITTADICDNMHVQG